jgi:dephospho-CoA kinase
VAAFGPEYLSPDGSLDRRKLGRLVFEEATARHRLESIVHPEVRRLMGERAAEAERTGVRVVVMEVPLLFEARLEREVDKVVVVDAHPAAQVQRLMARDGLTEDEARLRLAAQWSREERARRADYLIDNSGAWEETKQQVERLWEEINREETPRPGGAR